MLAPSGSARATAVAVAANAASPAVDTSGRADRKAADAPSELCNDDDVFDLPTTVAPSDLSARHREPRVFEQY